MYGKDKKIKQKIMCIVIISILLLSSLSLTAVGIKVSKIENINESGIFTGINQIDLVYGKLTDNDGNELSMPCAELFGTDIVISCVFYNSYYGPTEQFKVAFYWNNDTEPFDTETYQLRQNKVVVLILGPISMEDLPDKKGYPTLKVKMILDYNNDIDESNYNGDAEDNNIAYSNTLQNPKAKSINLLFSNVLARLLDNYPLLQLLLNL